MTSVGSGPAEAEAMVPCEGGRRRVGWIRVPSPPPLEVDRGVDGCFVLDDRPDGPVYVAIE